MCKNRCPNNTVSCCCNNAVADDFQVFGSEFTSPNEYKNQFLKGRMRLTLRGVKRLDFKTDWEFLPDGGFKILIPGFAVTTDVVIEGEFY